MHIPFCFVFLFFCFYYNNFFLLNKKYNKKERNMSTEIVYLLNLHKDGKIDDSALNKALNALQPSTQNRLADQDEPPVKSRPTKSFKVPENIHQKRREKKSIKNKDIQRH